MMDEAMFGYLPVSPQMEFREETVCSIVADYEPILEGLGGERWTEERLSDPRPLFYFLVSGGTESEVLRLREERYRSAPDEPVFLLTHPGNNSLPAALEVLARLQQDGAHGRIFFLRGPSDTEGQRQMAVALHDLDVWHALQRARIGCIGEPSDWLVASRPSPSVVQQVWGPEVVTIDLQAVEEMIRSTSEEAVSSHVHLLSDRKTHAKEPSQANFQEAICLYLALKQVVEAHGLDALTVRCFDLALDMEITACFALAQLNDEGIIAGCEGDLVSTVGLLWAYKLVEQIPWMANPVRVDGTYNTIWLAHCTVPRTLVEHYSCRSHFESGLSVGIQGHLPRGPVTLLRIGGSRLDRLWLAEGEILRTRFAEDLCRTQAEIRLHGDCDVRDLLREPLGNHLVMVSGHHLTRLKAWQESMITLA
jgi:L-fucose isomerase-like protein